MDDLISRQAAIDALIAEGRNVDSRYLESERIIHESDAVEAISLLPSAQQWIPVSERLPEDEGWYLVTDNSGGVRWLEVEHYDTEFGLKPFWSVQNPVAWMPLPDPWKGEDDGKG